MRRIPIVPRLLLALVAGMLVFGISCAVAYNDYRDSAIRYPQILTLQRIAKVASAVEAYRQKNHVLPGQLCDIGLETIRTDENGTPLDWWSRPLHYWTNGTHYRITSYGYGGKPGGVGLDYGLSSDNLTSNQVSQAGRSGVALPRQARATFRQFVTDRGDYARRYHFHGSGFGMVLTSMLTGAIAFVLAFLTIGGTAPIRGRIWSRVVRLVVITAGTLFMGMMITALHAPSAH